MSRSCVAEAIRSTTLDKPFQSSSGEGIVPSFSRTSPVVLISWQLEWCSWLVILELFVTGYPCFRLFFEWYPRSLRWPLSLGEVCSFLASWCFPSTQVRLAHLDPMPKDCQQVTMLSHVEARWVVLLALSRWRFPRPHPHRSWTTSPLLPVLHHKKLLISALQARY